MASKKLPPLPGLAVPSLPGLPTLVKTALPTAAKMDTMARPKTIAQMQEDATNPLDVNMGHYDGENFEHDLTLDMTELGDQFAAIREARASQADAVDLANDTEFWIAVYFQTREQSLAFTDAIGTSTNKYIDGLEMARLLKIDLPERKGKYKVGKIDAKLAKLT